MPKMQKNCLRLAGQTLIDAEKILTHFYDFNCQVQSVTPKVWNDLHIFNDSRLLKIVVVVIVVVLVIEKF